MKKNIKWFAAALVALTLGYGAVSCGSDSKEPEWEWPDPDPDPDPEPGVEKPRFIWVDAAANFPDFASSKENILRDLTKAREAGFTDIVVDVRPTTGDVLFRTSVVDQVEWLGAWLPGGYSKVERTATWDYLQAFIDAGKSLDLRIHAAINTFTGGNQTSLGGAGVVFREEAKRAWTTDLNLAGGITNIMSTSQSAKFFNPVLPEVQEYLCSMLKDLAAYDGLAGIFLDRGRFDGFTSDFSNYTRKEFEKYIGRSVASFPADILPAGHTLGIPSPEPVHMKQWLEFRAKVIHDFMEKARAAVKSVNPSVKFGVYVGGWYASYYDVGVNWASEQFDPARYFDWATPEYKNTGYADLLDIYMTGLYYTLVTKAEVDKANGAVGQRTEAGMSDEQNYWYCIEGGAEWAKKITCGVVPVTGSIYVEQYEGDAAQFTRAVAQALRDTDGLMIFDIVHIINRGWWSELAAGIAEGSN